MKRMLTIALVLGTCSISGATIINIPADYQTIQQGIDASNNGDTVLVQPGTYVENVNFNGHNIVLGSLYLITGDTSYISITTIDGDSSGSVVIFENGEDSTAMITGFTVRNGSASYGSGILCRTSGPTILKNLISENATDWGFGGGIYCDSSGAIIKENTISYNSTLDGGGIYCHYSDPTIIGNIIRNNTAGACGGIFCNNSDAIIVNNIISDNTSNFSGSEFGGGGIFCWNSNPAIAQNIICRNKTTGTCVGGGILVRASVGGISSPNIINNTIYGNYSTRRGNGICCDGYSTPNIINNIIWANADVEIYVSATSSPSIRYCDIQGGYEGESNIDLNPLFCGDLVNDFNVCSQSPCIDAGDPNILDPDGTRSDIGMFYMDHPFCSLGNLWHVSTLGNDTTGNGSPQNPFRTIQHGIDVSHFGDTVVADNGTFIENIDFHGKSVLLTSNYIFTADTLDIVNTIINGSSTSDPIVTFLGCDSGAAVTGFSIIRDPVSANPNIDCLGADVEIENNIITGSNVAGIRCRYSNLAVSNNVIYGNGCGISGSYSNLIIANNIISGNSMIGSGGGIGCWISNVGIFNNIISDNSVFDFMGYDGEGGGIYYSNSDAAIINNTITGNYASLYGGGMCGWGNGIIMNSIFWGNTATLRNEIWGSAIISYCDIQDTLWPGEGNISVDPLFRDPGNNDFHLKAVECGDQDNSPCIDAGYPFHEDSLLDCSYGLGTVICDIGAYGGGIRPSSGIIHVPDDYPAIQLAIMVSSDGDTVLVYPGIYTENIDFMGRRIVVGSLFLTTGDTSYISSTIIDGDSSGSVVTFENEEDSTSVITGFTIRNGFATYGGGISCEGSHPLICNNIISENVSTYGGGIQCQNSNAIIRDNVICGNISTSGGGIYCQYSDALIIGNAIRANTAYTSFGSGGGIRCNNSSSIICDNEISSNSAVYNGGGVYSSSSDPTFSNNIFFNNTAGRFGGAVYSQTSIEPLFYNNVVYGNNAEIRGGGLYCYYSNPMIKNTIFWDNYAPDFPEIFFYGTSTLDVTYSDIEGGWQGEGNIDIGPLFRDPANGNFKLMAIYCGDSLTSPCIDAGDPAILDSLLDCDWGMGWYRSDMGAYGGGDSATVGISDNGPSLPDRFMLLQNYPNPFNAATKIRYSLPEAYDVIIEIYDILGRKVQTLVQGRQPAGHHQVIWDAGGMASGLYFYRIQAGDYIETKKMTLLK